MMSLQNLNRIALRQILKDSQGYPAQSDFAKAKLMHGVHGISLRSAAAGHALSSHVSGVSKTACKTKFCSLDAMVDALYLTLQTAQGVQALGALTAGSRETVDVMLPRLFDIDAEFGQPPRTLQKRFAIHDLMRWGLHLTNTFAVLEGRKRGSELYLHVQTFFPKLSQQQVLLLFDKATSP